MNSLRIFNGVGAGTIEAKEKMFYESVRNKLEVFNDDTMTDQVL